MLETTAISTSFGSNGGVLCSPKLTGEVFFTAALSCSDSGPLLKRIYTTAALIVFLYKSTCRWHDVGEIQVLAPLIMSFFKVYVMFPEEAKEDALKQMVNEEHMFRNQTAVSVAGVEDNGGTTTERWQQHPEHWHRHHQWMPGALGMKMYSEG